MRYFLFTELPGFYVREWEKRDPDRAGEPIAVHRDKRVIDANAAALESGVLPGMGLEEAKALLQGVGLILFEEEPYRQSQKRWLDVLCEFSSVIQPHEPHSAWADITGHPQPLAIAAQIRRTLRTRFGIFPRMGLAGTRWLARLAADLLSDANASLWEDASREALVDPARFLGEVPIHLLYPIELSHRERLRFLGYRTAGDVSQIPLRTLRSQFGTDAPLIQSVSRGRYFEPVRPDYPPDQITVRAVFEGGLTNLEDVRAALEALSRRIAKALSDRESHGATLYVKVGFEENTLTLNRTFSNTIRTARQAFMALTRIVGSPQEPIFSIEVQMPKLKKASERQSGLFVARNPGDDVAVQKAVERVRDVFGDASVIRASERIEPRRIRVLRAWSHATGWK